MRNKFDPVFRKALKELLKKHNAEVKNCTTKKVTLSDIDSIISHLYSVPHKSRQAVQVNLQNQLSFCYLCISCLFYLSLSIYDDEKKNEGLYPAGYLAPNSDVNPNFIFMCLLTNITNFASSIVHLVELGQDNSARVLLRSLIELCWQTMILAADKDTLIEYLAPEDEKTATETWYRLFGKGRLRNKIKKIEKELGVKEYLSSQADKERHDTYQFFSMSVHHSRITSAIGAFAFNFEDDNANLGLLGGHSQGSIATLKELCSTLLYFILYFVAIHVRINKMSFGNPKNAYWYEAVMLYECIKDIWGLCDF